MVGRHRRRIGNHFGWKGLRAILRWSAVIYCKVMWSMHIPLMRMRRCTILINRMAPTTLWLTNHALDGLASATFLVHVLLHHSNCCSVFQGASSNLHTRNRIWMVCAQFTFDQCCFGRICTIGTPTFGMKNMRTIVLERIILP